MKKDDAIKYFGSKAATARALRISENSVHRWPNVLTNAIAFRVELASKGALKSDETLRHEQSR